MARISVVIPTLPENYERLNKCVNSLFKHKSGFNELEFCIVPNNWDGFERPVNKGIAMATGDYILICNDDVIATEHYWDVWMVEGLKNNEYGLVSGTGHSWKDLASFWFVMIPKHVIDLIGNLDESFFVFSSDYDYCMRIKQAGLKINHAGRCPGIHHQYCSTTKSKVFAEKIGDEQHLIEQNKEVFFKKWGFK